MIGEREIEGLFRQGFDCGQVVLASAADKLGLDKDTACKLAAGFGAGMFRGQSCGAVVGAVMGLGMKYGHFQPGMADAKDQIRENTLEFQRKFMEIYPSTVCRDLLGYDIAKPEQMDAILDKGLLFNFCPKVVADASRLLDELL